MSSCGDKGGDDDGLDGGDENKKQRRQDRHRTLERIRRDKTASLIADIQTELTKYTGHKQPGSSEFTLNKALLHIVGHVKRIREEQDRFQQDSGTVEASNPSAAEDSDQDPEHLAMLAVMNCGTPLVMLHMHGGILEANAAFAEVLGYAVEHLRSMTIYVLTAPDDLADLMTLLYSLLSVPAGSVQKKTVRLIHRQGNLLEFHIHVSYITGESPVYTMWATPAWDTLPKDGATFNLQLGASGGCCVRQEAPALTNSHQPPEPLQILQYRAPPANVRSQQQQSVGASWEPNAPSMMQGAGPPVLGMRGAVPDMPLPGGMMQQHQQQQQQQQQQQLLQQPVPAQQFHHEQMNASMVNYEMPSAGQSQNPFFLYCQYGVNEQQQPLQSPGMAAFSDGSRTGSGEWTSGNDMSNSMPSQGPGGAMMNVQGQHPGMQGGRPMGVPYNQGFVHGHSMDGGQRGEGGQNWGDNGQDNIGMIISHDPLF